MRIAVAGKAGQVVTSLIERATAAGHDIIAIDRPDLDLADPASVVRALTAAAPDAIVSAAAYKAVDKAESESDLAFAVNGAGAGAVAQAAKALGVPLIHISTDYVFDGTLDRPYVESYSTGLPAFMAHRNWRANLRCWTAMTIARSWAWHGFTARPAAISSRPCSAWRPIATNWA